MLEGWFIVLVSFAYLCLLFAIAYYGDKRADEGRSLIGNPYIYALSIAVYCTSWTFYGSVGRAASEGISFLPIYLGPTLTFVLWWFVLRKMIRISKANRITSIADFISSRYGKSTRLSGLVTVIAVVGIMPYISLQLKAVSTSFTVLLQYPDIVMPHEVATAPILGDTALWIALALALFAILFGTRHIDASERHEGMVAAIAFESIVKLLAFLAVGIFVTFGLYDGFGDLFARAAAVPEISRLFTMEATGGFGQWATLMVLSMAAILCLPRQFQVSVIENVDESHLDKAIWLFPLYLLAINIFVLPIAVSGLLHFPSGNVDGDTFVLTVPMAERQEALALFAFIGGLSAATGMVIVATIALSTMICNDLVMPALLRLTRLRLAERGDLPGLLLGIRRGSIIGILLLGYLYFRFIGGSYALVTIGLVSFAAAAQFAPAMIGGMFWKGGTQKGALAGLSLGFLAWAYTLLLPSLALSGWLPVEFVERGPFGIELLRPYQLLGLMQLDHISHAMFWSMLLNIGSYIGVSLTTRQSATERIQAALFVDVFRYSEERHGPGLWRGTATFSDLYEIVVRFVGREQAERAFSRYAHGRSINLGPIYMCDPLTWVTHVYRSLNLDYGFRASAPGQAGGTGIGCFSNPRPFSSISSGRSVFLPQRFISASAHESPLLGLRKHLGQEPVGLPDQLFDVVASFGARFGLPWFDDFVPVHEPAVKIVARVPDVLDVEIKTSKHGQNLTGLRVHHVEHRLDVFYGLPEKYPHTVELFPSSGLVAVEFAQPYDLWRDVRDAFETLA